MKKLVVGFAVVAGIVPLVSLAAYFNAGRVVDMGASQAVNDNAYVAGGNVTVSSPIGGDLLAAGGTVFVSGNVKKDIMAIGGTVIFSGATAENLRAAGGTITVGSAVSGELVAAGGQIMVTPDTTVAKDSYLRGGTVTWNGNETGNLDIGGGAVTIGGTIDKNLTITATKSVTIAPGAIIKGNFDYTAPAEATVKSGARILGTTTFHRASTPADVAHRAGWFGMLFGFLAFWAIAKFLMVLLLAYLLWYLFRKDAVAIMEEATSRFGKSLLRGFLFLVAVPIAVIIAFITVLGTMLGVVAGLVYVAFVILASATAVLTVSSLVMKRRTDLRWHHILLGAVILTIAAVIPFIGWIAYFIVWLASFGALLAVAGGKFRR